MGLYTISEVTRKYQLSTRTLRYYEQIGLLRSSKKEGYAYRTYDQGSLRILEQILILRRLRIPLRDIQTILQNEESRVATAIFQKKIKELSDEIAAMASVKSILEQFASSLKKNTDLKIGPELLADKSIRKIIEALPASRSNLKEHTLMNNGNKVDYHGHQLNDVRIVYVPPSSVASIHVVSGSPEYETEVELRQFMISTDLASKKPDLRHYGFNHPTGVKPDGTDHGYERWVTIPDDMEVQKPFVKKFFPGGLYAAHMIPMGNFEEWHWLAEWVEQSSEYEPNWGDPECMHGSMEEHLNYMNQYQLSVEDTNQGVQLDLLLPIKSKGKD